MSIKNLERRLEALTPQGSEYANNPERCLAYVEERMGKYFSTIVEAKKQATAAEVTRDNLLVALEALCPEEPRFLSRFCEWCQEDAPNHLEDCEWQKGRAAIAAAKGGAS